MKNLTIKEAKELMKKNGGGLDLRGTQIQSLPDNLTVGGSLYLEGTQIQSLQKELAKVKTLNNGDYVPKRYLYADGILTHIKGHRKIQGYVFYQGKIKGKNVVSDGTNYAHCNTLREGIADLTFKAAKDRGAEQYKDITLDTELSFKEMVTMYRIITGACRQGTESFISTIKNPKEKYTVREAIEITSGQYGAESFKRFFEEG